MNKKIIIWLLCIIPAAIMLQTLYFKFTAQPESVKLFSLLHMEPWGRIGTGVLETIASVLLLVPRTRLLGALLGLGIMSGAVFFHLSNPAIGINYGGSPLLFIYASVTLLCCVILIYIHKQKIPNLLKLNF
jgi:uncharacterized membrane protein YphA (DoxX/SURF4 family)